VSAAAAPGTTPRAPRVPLPASTVTLVRHAAGGYEVLMLRRNLKSGFVPGQYLFPGGAVDVADHAPECCALCMGLDDPAASRALSLPQGGLAWWAAAIRESFEEAGILLAYEAHGEVTRLSEARKAARFAEHRRRLNAGEEKFAAILETESLRMAADRLTYFGHWITPVKASRRYDTRFFIAEAPPEQDVLHDNVEAIGHVWIRPAAALDQFRAGTFEMRTPTRRTLEVFADYDSADSLLHAMRQPREIPSILPRILPDGRRLLPGEPGYEEAGMNEDGQVWQK